MPVPIRQLLLNAHKFPHFFQNIKLKYNGLRDFRFFLKDIFYIAVKIGSISDLCGHLHEFQILTIVLSNLSV